MVHTDGRPPAIETRGLTKRFGEALAVDRLELSVPAGEIYGFLGPNGSGKSTTIRMLLGLLTPDAGEVRMWGTAVERAEPNTLARIGALVESPSLYRHLTGLQNLEIVRQLRGLPMRACEDALEAVALAASAHAPVRGYSLGMQQRLGIAIALLGSPELLVLDEPSNGMDPAGIRDMRALLLNLAANGTTVLLSSHLLAEVAMLASTIGVIQRGRLVYQGSPAKLPRVGCRTASVSTDDDHRARSILTAGGWDVHDEGENGLVVSVASDEMLGQIAPLLVDHRVTIFRIALNEPTLEDAFLALTSPGVDAH